MTSNVQSMKQFYRRLVFNAQRNFHQWTRLAIEIINHHQYRPEVYFNFVKHILLAGQNLLNTFKLLRRQWKQHAVVDQMIELDRFSTNFLDQLKQIVMKTKRLTFTRIDPKIMSDIVEQIRLALEMSDLIRQKCFT
ncbi:hypothetical protein BLA29_012427 [Euroglyphus maynei]|uniref:Uncharacterized protein n=1 Tax=Euroglyphus maynei TaxID=6958 RepID=A0A1Y3BNZ8_EURMA|nr:hypothetical protein BLA29_012427 [Euroglyphus maynei]